MAMSIDEAIKHGEEQLEIFGGEHNEFIQTAIDTMRKYRKIKEIVKRYGKPDKEETDKFYWDVIGVVEDGND